MRYDAIVVGVSTGGWDALNKLIPGLPKIFGTPIIIAQHVARTSDRYLVRKLDTLSPLTVREAEDKVAIDDYTIYLAPANYHLLAEQNRTLALSVCPPVNYSRPSIDVLFESAADAFGRNLIGILLTGASPDGSRGLMKIKQKGGLTIVQDPKTAESAIMPLSAINLFEVDHVMSLEKLVPFLLSTLALRKTRRNGSANTQI